MKTKTIIKMIILTILVFGIFVGMHIDAQKYRNTGQHVLVNKLKFITVGDPQINSTTFEGVERLKQVINFANESDVDFIIFEGDMTDDGTNMSNDMVKDILKDLKKPYYVVVGNHDMYISPKIFESYYGPMEHIENINGYQLIFVGIKDVQDKNGVVTKLDWSFDFSKASKSAPTLVFIHGPVMSIPTGCIYCRMQKDILAYGYSMRPELDRFTNLIGVYSGHVHYDSNRVVNGTRYVTMGGLVNITIGKIPVVHASNKIGYSTIEGNKSSYELMTYD